MSVHKTMQFFAVLSWNKGRKELVPSRGKHNMDAMTSVTSYQAFFFWGGGGGEGKSDAIKRKREEGPPDCRLWSDLQASMRNSEELLGCFFRVNENKLTTIMFSKLFAKEITKNAIR